MFCDKSETMKTSHLALVVLTAGLLCIGNAGCSDAAVAAFEATLAKAKAGDAEAMVHLGIMYATGEGVIEDDVEAYAWFNVTAKMVRRRPPSYATISKRT